MTRPTTRRLLTEQERIQKVLDETARHLGVNIEDLGLSAEELAVNQTVGDQIAEAQAVLWFMETKGEGFTRKPCVSCGLEFAYSWDRTSITCCSVECISSELEKKGLSWKINRPLHLRWGRTVPAVVPPGPLSLIDSLLQEYMEIQSDQPVDTPVEEDLELEDLS